MSFVICIALIFNLASAYIIFENPPFEIPWNGEMKQVIFSSVMRIMLFIGSILGIILSVYPLISLKK
ncbi:hypothetical protein ACQPU1_06945 [Clostridium paraputrificum]|uniref:hypothetical protein n=1 Tax=Clostridium TaxID=1485 RepID=UPI003D33ADEB